MNNNAINAIRFLGVDAINKANSGHPGIVLGAAPMLHVLYTKHLNINPKDDKWINRDRFILSAGHGSALLYAINHLSGFKVSIEDLKNFRQIGNTPGHPEYGHTHGIETTSGPLGQGISNAVGMALAETHLAAKFNKPELSIFDHYTYVLCGDGDLQEGVTMESMSLAGHLGLSKLIVLYDSNDIQLDGKTSLAYSDNAKKKFEAMGWQHLLVTDGEDLESIDKAIKKAKKETDKPTIIEVKTIIGRGTSIEGTSKVHGAPIGLEEAKKLREKLQYKNEPFEVDQEVYDFYKKNVLNRGKRVQSKWNKELALYKEQYHNEYEQLMNYYSQPEVDLSLLPTYEKGSKEATRNVSGKVIESLSKTYTNLIGGSADLTASTKAKGADGDFTKENRLGRNINFGVREHAMASIANGMVLHGGLKVFVGGFFVFSDYMKPAIRLASIMQIPVTYVFTHDTVAVGEDGPTHEPIEQLVMLRSIPNLVVLRPADANETKMAWKIAMESKDHPTAIILTRQSVPNLETSTYEGVNKGGYIISKEEQKLDGILLASGSEVSLALKAKEILKQKNIDIRVVSMPSIELFEKQEKAYKDSILPKEVKILAVEMASPLSWYKYTQHVYGINTFGVSAPLEKVLEHFGYTPQDLADGFIKL
ncbi:Transketolase [Alteracholeplasma palmae J233]|uniref:Transketolase n=1 Tax=Alteracholeplasma palmae (strain ATCC 49389 / J233) TaxID=1318466 RepID=U4KLY3_ALTPJ|nr:transketolase [Alteracholeplasma palmae]CCV64938.1 Transketolase [Alteracholeplasma palmae J233]